MNGSYTLTTEIGGSDGYWAPIPERWSFSSLSEIESCPRRFGLRRASYPQIWERSGYPELPFLHSVIGQVVHKSLELIVRALAREGCTGVDSECSVSVLRSLGGHTAVVERAIEEELQRFDGNPRAQPVIQNINTQLTKAIPRLRRDTQSLLARTTVAGGVGPRSGPAPSEPVQRFKRGPGSHPEALLEAESIRMVGCVDLLSVTGEGCEIVDYKSGMPKESHLDQVRLYGLLWLLDGVSNPEKAPIASLSVAYPSQIVTVDIPNPEEFADLESEINGRVQEAELSISSDDPTALPSEDCVWCPVRQMCPDYWKSEVRLCDPESGFADVELEVQDRHGSRSWRAFDAEGSVVLVRTMSEEAPFNSGDRVRLLSVLLGAIEDEETPVVTMTAQSETFCLRE